MRILISGATGFIGSAIAARLAADGHDVVAGTRRLESNLPGMRHVYLDLVKLAHPENWTPHLVGIDAVVNCAGILQDTPQASTKEVHQEGASALFRACERCGVRRVIHFSAVGVDRETPTEFSRTKLAGDRALMALDLDWIILRPSVVVGRGAYGGSALLRGLASLPLFPVMPDTAPLQLVHLDDVVETVVFFLQPAAPSREAIELVGPRSYGFAEAVALFRAWLRRPPARSFHVPRWIAGLLYRAGDLAAWFGWRPPLRSTAAREMVRGAVGDASALTEITGIKPRAIERCLLAEPASVQERWFARLYPLKPLLFVVFSAFWIATAVVSLGPGRERGIALVMEGGLSRTMAALLTISGGLADLVIGILIAFRRTTRWGLYAALTISVTYAMIGTVLVPRLWFDPLGPMLKIAPVMVLNLVAIAIYEDR